MVLTAEIDHIMTGSGPISCSSLGKVSSVDVDSVNIEFSNAIYLSSDDPILDQHLDDESFMKIDFVDDDVFCEATTPDFADCAVIALSGESPQRNEKKTEKDFDIKSKLETSTSSSPPPSSEDSNIPLTRRDYLLILSTFFIALVAKGNSAGLSILAVEWLHQFENSKALILYVPALNFAITSAAGVFNGVLINKFGMFRIILFGCFLQVTCMIGSAFSTNAVTLVIVLGFLAGLGNCFLFVNAFIFVGVQFGEAAKPIIAFLSVAGPIGGLIFPNLVPIFIEYYGWRSCMFLLAGIYLQVVPLAIFMGFAKKNPKTGHASSEAGNKRTSGPSTKKLLDLSLLKNFVFVMYALSVGFTVGGINSVFSMLPDFLYEKGLNLREAAQLFAVYYTISAVPRIVIGFVVKYTKVNFIHIYITMASLFGFTMALMNLAESYSALLVSCILWSLWMGCPAGLYSIGIMELVGPDKHGSGTGIVETSYGVTTAFFGFLAGLSVQYTDSYQKPFYIYGTSIVVINIGLLIAISAQQIKIKLGFSKLINK